MSHHAPDQDQSVRELRRLVEAPLRRPVLVLVPLLLVLAGAIALSFWLPARYRSSTLILVAPESMPDNFVRQMTTEKITRRLQTLRQEMQSRTRLERVARELDPYGWVGRQPIVSSIERMRENVTVTVKGNDAFSIEFEHRDPRMAMLVAERLTTLFMDEVVGAREKQVSVAYQFIESQLEEARRELEQKEAALAVYKERHMGALPEQVNANLATLQRLQLEQQTLSESLRAASDAVARVEAEAIEAQERSAVPTPLARDPLVEQRARRAELLIRYTPEHPDVRALDARIAVLERAEAGAAARRQATTKAEPPASPTRERLFDARRERDRLRERYTDVERQIDAFQARVDSAPRREQEILALTRDYGKLRENYSSLLAKKLDAEMAARLEQEARGQQFRVIDPAYLPERPSFPDRGLIAFVGAILGLGVGVALAVMADALDPTIKDVHEVGSVLLHPVLAVMPSLSARQQRRLAAAADAHAEARTSPEPADDDEPADDEEVAQRRLAGGPSRL